MRWHIWTAVRMIPASKVLNLGMFSKRCFGGPLVTGSPFSTCQLNQWFLNASTSRAPEWRYSKNKWFAFVLGIPGSPSEPSFKLCQSKLKWKNMNWQPAFFFLIHVAKTQKISFKKGTAVECVAFLFTKLKDNVKDEREDKWSNCLCVFINVENHTIVVSKTGSSSSLAQCGLTFFARCVTAQ